MGRNDFVMNEVALDYNSGFQMAVAGLLNDVAGATTTPPTAPPTDAPTAGPTDGPTDPATTRDPNNNCPEETLRPAYPSAQRRMLTSTRPVCMTAWRTVEW